jgi:hypothetical protein
MAGAIAIGEGKAAAAGATAPAAWSLLEPAPRQLARFPADMPARLLIIIDTEEEFDWDRPLRATPYTVGSARAQVRAQAIFARVGLKPTYLVDYPIAASPEGYGPLPDWVRAGTAQVGAHLHPWVNPPFGETDSRAFSYPGNLPEELEEAKLAALTDAIHAAFGLRPTVYKAGRYGVGEATPRVLERLGYRIDASVVPEKSFAADSGPDFTRCLGRPYWFGSNGGLLELPLTSGYFGAVRGAARLVYPRLASRIGLALKLPGIASRLGLLTRSVATPEGESVAEAKALTRALHREGQRIFCVTYHSPSLEPGHTPYVRDESDLARFLAWLEAYCEFFLGELDGQPATPFEIYEEAARCRSQIG